METMTPHLATTTEPAMIEHRKDRKRAFELIRTMGFGRGKITLASGKESDFYFNLKRTMLSPEGSHILAKLIIERLGPLNIDYVGGLVMGAVPLIGPINQLSYMQGKPLPGFFVREERKTHGTMEIVEGVMKGELDGKNVAVLDDVTTTGGSAMIAVNEVRAIGANVVLVLSVVDRDEGAKDFYRERNVEFDSLFTAREFLDF